ncbi:MAG: type IV toxin-antitoxin system AbiEi family antitoxin domain-containing protein [Alphaproteobacteria bacterium]|nr:type IV toxin-antitoxin system AbiEi family antitoxin domain-containing protein [Alphaproteobacteria bacterium]
MTTQRHGKLNQLQKLLPEGLLADAAWFERHGYSTALRSQYVSSGWLEQPARGVYRRPEGNLSWPMVVVSLQRPAPLDEKLVVGGRTALEFQGYAHYLPQSEKEEVHLYGNKKLPSWVKKIPFPYEFIYHSDRRLFSASSSTYGLSNMKWNDWPLTLSTPERALLQLLDELPQHESFHQVDKLFEGLANLSPHRLQKLLVDCQSVKVKRLFFFFADRHNHTWLKHLDKSRIDLGSGKRVLVKDGKLDSTYQITLPKDMFDGSR